MALRNYSDYDINTRSKPHLNVSCPTAASDAADASVRRGCRRCFRRRPRDQLRPVDCIQQPALEKERNLAGPGACENLHQGRKLREQVLALRTLVGNACSAAHLRPRLCWQVGTIGHVDHGKTTLTAALCKVGAAHFTRLWSHGFNLQSCSAVVCSLLSRSRPWTPPPQLCLHSAGWSRALQPVCAQTKLRFSLPCLLTLYHAGAGGDGHGQGGGL